MRGLSETLHAVTLGSSLLLVLGVLLSATPGGEASAPSAPRADTMRQLPYTAPRRQRRDLDLEGLPADIREKIMASRRRGSRHRPIVEPNCWVEVDVPKRLEGVCKRIENMPACAVNDNLYIDHPDCMEI